MKVYTRRGDDGTTGLLHGGRVDKHDLRTEAYGTVDEAVSALALARAELASTADGEWHDRVLEVQRELFVLGADLATNPNERHRLEGGVSFVTGDMVAELESTIDRLVADHPLPREFIVPGANPVSAALDLARGTVRRAERRSVEMRDSGRPVNEHALRYLNRLSDLLFVMARWQAGGNEEPSRER